MPSSSGTSSTRWLLEATCTSRPCADAAWHRQRQLLASFGSYDPTSQVWTVRIGALNADTLATLNALYEAASAFGTHVSWAAVVAPDHWRGEAFENAGDLAQIAAANRDQHRPLGQLPT